MSDEIVETWTVAHSFSWQSEDPGEVLRQGDQLQIATVETIPTTVAQSRSSRQVMGPKPVVAGATRQHFEIDRGPTGTRRGCFSIITLGDTDLLYGVLGRKNKGPVADEDDDTEIFIATNDPGAPPI